MDEQPDSDNIPTNNCAAEVVSLSDWPSGSECRSDRRERPQEQAESIGKGGGLYDASQSSGTTRLWESAGIQLGFPCGFLVSGSLVGGGCQLGGGFHRNGLGG